MTSAEITQVAQAIGWGELSIIMIILLAVGVVIAPLFIWGHTYATSKTLKDIDATLQRIERAMGNNP